jgi:putative addiction module component (TIGR02574 family)
VLSPESRSQARKAFLLFAENPNRPGLRSKLHGAPSFETYAARPALCREIILLCFSGGDNVAIVSTSMEELRDSIAAESPAIDLSKEQIAELDRRLDALEAQPESGTPWHIARERILASGTLL